MKFIFNVFLIMLAVFGIIFASLNSEAIKVDYFMSTITLPVSVLIFISLVMGLILGLVITLYVFLKLKKENYKLKSQVKVARQEIDNLRALPIQDSH